MVQLANIINAFFNTNVQIVQLCKHVIDDCIISSDLGVVVSHVLIDLVLVHQLVVYSLVIQIILIGFAVLVIFILGQVVLICLILGFPLIQRL